MHVAINKLRLVLRNVLPFCNLIGSARIPAETKGQPKKVNVSNQTPFSEGGAVGVVWGRDYKIRGGTTRVVQLAENNTTPRDNLYDGT